MVKLLVAPRLSQKSVFFSCPSGTFEELQSTEEVKPI